MKACIVALALPICIVAFAARADVPSVEHGHAVFNAWCAPCHAPGPGHPGTAALTAKYKGKVPGELEKRTDLSAQLINQVVRHGISVMPIFRKTEVSDEDLAALSRYLSKPGS